MKHKPQMDLPLHSSTNRKTLCMFSQLHYRLQQNCHWVCMYQCFQEHCLLCADQQSYSRCHSSRIPPIASNQSQIGPICLPYLFSQLWMKTSQRSTSKWYYEISLMFLNWLFRAAWSFTHFLKDTWENLFQTPCFTAQMSQCTGFCIDM